MHSRSSSQAQSTHSRSRSRGEATPNTPEPPSTASSPWMIPVCIGLTLLVLSVFLHSKNFGFLQYDDNQYIQEIPAVIAGLTWDSIKWAWTHSHVGQWHPLTTMSFMLDSSLGAMATGNGFHLTNVLLHTLASLLLLCALRSLTGSFWRSAIATALFAIHPLRAESVAWITERKDVLSGVFLMANLWAYSFYTKRPQSWARYTLVCVLFALGLLSKPMLVTLPFVFLLLDFWPLNRIGWDHTPQNQKEWMDFLGRLMPLVLEKVPILLMAFASAVGAIYAQGDPFRPIPMLPLLPRWSYIPVSYLTYLTQFFYPVDLAPHYPYLASGAPWYKVLAATSLLTALTWGAWKARKQHPYVLVGWLWFLGTLLPVIGVVSPGIQILADRYTYLTQIGLAIALVWLLAHAIQSGRIALPKPVVAAFCIVTILVLSAMARIQTAHWKNDETLWEHALAVTKNNDYASEKMATTLQSKSQAHGNSPEAQALRDRAEALYREGLRINPHLVGSLNNLSILLRIKGQFDEAADLQQRAANEHPRWSLMHRNLASVLTLQKKYDEARKEYETAIRLDPNDLESRFHLGLLISEYIVGNQPAEPELPKPKEELPIAEGNTPSKKPVREALLQAAALFEEVIRKQPNVADAHFCLGNTSYRLSRFEEAAKSYERTLALEPKHSRAANNLASIYANFGRNAEAISLYKRAIEADPSYLEAARNLAESFFRIGDFAQSVQVWRDILNAKADDLQAIFRLSWMLATCPDANVRRPFEARDLANKGIEMTGGKEAALLDALGAAYAQLGRFEEAKEALQKALTLLPGNPSAQQLLKSRLELYNEGKAFVEALPQATPAPVQAPSSAPAQAPAPAPTEPQSVK